MRHKAKMVNIILGKYECFISIEAECYIVLTALP